jgi:cytidyltransferase-like protein
MTQSMTMKGRIRAEIHAEDSVGSSEKRDQVVLIVGVFDLFHAGHVKLLERARALGDRLVVVVNGDELTASYKRPPIMSEQDRLLLIQSCRYVDHAEISNDYSIRHIITKYKVAKIVHGDDWEIDSYKKQIRCDDAFLEQTGAELVLVPYTAGVSTSQIIETCAKQLQQKEAAYGRKSV